MSAQVPIKPARGGARNIGDAELAGLGQQEGGARFAELHFSVQMDLRTCGERDAAAVFAGLLPVGDERVAPLLYVYVKGELKTLETVHRRLLNRFGDFPVAIEGGQKQRLDSTDIGDQ